MTNMIVWRIEHPTTWRCKAAARFLWGDSRSHRKGGYTLTPSVYDDVPGFEDAMLDGTPEDRARVKQFVCGCTSARELRGRWFPLRVRRDMHRQGFVLRAYESDEVLVGRMQVMFLKAGATLVDERPVLTPAELRGEAAR